MSEVEDHSPVRSWRGHKPIFTKGGKVDDTVNPVIGDGGQARNAVSLCRNLPQPLLEITGLPEALC